MRQLCEVLRTGLNGIPCKVRPKYDGPFYNGVITNITHRNTLIKLDTGQIYSYPFDQVYINGSIIVYDPANLPSSENTDICQRKKLSASIPEEPR